MMIMNNLIRFNNSIKEATLTFLPHLKYLLALPRAVEQEGNHHINPQP